MAAKPLRLAVDTNVLLDQAAEVDDVLDALAIIERRLANADGLVSPSVLDELAFLCDSGQTEAIRKNARKAMRQLRTDRRFRPLLELPFGEHLVESLADEFLRRRLLPVEELHDAMILAEAALLDCTILLTSDAHLRAVDHEELTLVLHPHELTAPVIATPREIVRKFFR